MTTERSMTKLNPYLTLPGTAAEAIELYKKVFCNDKFGVRWMINYHEEGK